MKSLALRNNTWAWGCDTKALANDNAKWQHTGLAFLHGDATAFAGAMRGQLGDGKF
jgi:hypothetical protein